MICSKCQHPFEDDAAFCIECGAPRSTDRVCAHCGNVVRASHKFCSRCGRTPELTCSRCGSVVKAGQKFCKSCGQKVRQAVGDACCQCGAVLEKNSAFCSECGTPNPGTAPSPCPPLSSAAGLSSSERPELGEHKEEFGGGDVKPSSTEPEEEFTRPDDDDDDADDDDDDDDDDDADDDDDEEESDKEKDSVLSEAEDHEQASSDPAQTIRESVPESGEPGKVVDDGGKMTGDSQIFPDLQQASSNPVVASVEPTSQPTDKPSTEMSVEPTQTSEESSSLSSDEPVTHTSVEPMEEASGAAAAAAAADDDPSADLVGPPGPDRMEVKGEGGGSPDSVIHNDADGEEMEEVEEEAEKDKEAEKEEEKNKDAEKDKEAKKEKDKEAEKEEEKELEKEVEREEEKEEEKDKEKEEEEEKDKEKEEEEEKDKDKEDKEKEAEKDKEKEEEEEKDKDKEDKEKEAEKDKDKEDKEKEAEKDKEKEEQKEAEKEEDKEKEAEKDEKKEEEKEEKKGAEKEEEKEGEKDKEKEVVKEGEKEAVKEEEKEVVKEGEKEVVKEGEKEAKKEEQKEEENEAEEEEEQEEEKGEEKEEEEQPEEQEQAENDISVHHADKCQQRNAAPRKEQGKRRGRSRPKRRKDNRQEAASRKPAERIKVFVVISSHFKETEVNTHRVFFSWTTDTPIPRVEDRIEMNRTERGGCGGRLYEAEVDVAQLPGRKFRYKYGVLLEGRWQWEHLYFLKGDKHARDKGRLCRELNLPESKVLQKGPWYVYDWMAYPSGMKGNFDKIKGFFGMSSSESTFFCDFRLSCSLFLPTPDMVIRAVSNHTDPDQPTVERMLHLIHVVGQRSVHSIDIRDHAGFIAGCVHEFLVAPLLSWLRTAVLDEKPTVLVALFLLHLVDQVKVNLSVEDKSFVLKSMLIRPDVTTESCPDVTQLQHHFPVFTKDPKKADRQVELLDSLHP